MKNDYLIVHKSVLPKSYEDVVMAKELIEIEKISVSDACKKMNISRSTFYKYKEYVNRPSDAIGKRIILSLKLVDEPGSLSNILNDIASRKANILAINQELPIHNVAFVTLTISINDMDISIQSFVNELKLMKNVIDVLLLAVE